MKKIATLICILLVITGCNKGDTIKEDPVETVTEGMTKDQGEMDMEVIDKQFNETHFLSVVDKEIRMNYGQGETVSLRGVNIGGYLLQEFWMTPTKPGQNVHDEMSLVTYLEDTYGKERSQEILDTYMDAYFTEVDFDRISDLGCNVIRLPFWYRNITDNDNNIYEDWFERFDWFIEEAGKRGIYVILDFHGAPGSQNGSDHSGVDGGEDKEAASKFFYGSEEEVRDNQELFMEIWELMAERYKNNPTVAGYDLLNEPYCTYRYNSQKTEEELHKDLWTVYDKVYQRIRAIDKNHIIMMEATWDPKDLPNPKDYGWENIVYEYHNYLYDDYDNEAGKQISNMKHKISLIKSANYNVPSLMGEFNYFNNYEAWDEGLALLNDEDIHWTMWTYKTTSDYGNWGLYHHTCGDLNIEKVDDIKLIDFYKKVGQVRENERLIEIVKGRL